MQEMLNAGVVNNQAELARKLGLSRARVTQIMNLLKLPVDIREYILQLPHTKQRGFTERKLREIAALSTAQVQRKAFACLETAVDQR